LNNDQSLINAVPEPSEETSSLQFQSSFDSKNESEVDKTSTKIEIYADTDSYFSFRIIDPLSTVWKNTIVALFLNVHSPLKWKTA